MNTINSMNTTPCRLALRGVVLALTACGTLRANSFELTPNDSTWSYDYVNREPSMGLDNDPERVKLKSLTSGSDGLYAITWSPTDMAQNPILDIVLPRRAVVDSYRIGSYIFNQDYGIPASTLSSRTNSALPYVQIAANNVTETWTASAGAQVRYYPVATPTVPGRFVSRNEGSEFLMQFFNQGKRLNLGHIRLYGHWYTCDTVGTGYIGYDYEVQPGDTVNSGWYDDGNDLVTRLQGDYNEGSNPNGQDAGSVCWIASTMSTTTVAVVFDMGGGHKVDRVDLGSYFHTAEYLIPPLKFEVSRRIDRPEWTEIGTYAGLAHSDNGAKSVSITGFDDAPGCYLRMSTTVMTNARFNLYEVKLTTTSKPLWPLTTVMTVR